MTDKYTTPSSWPWGFHRVRPIHLSSTVRKHLRPQAGMRRQPDGLSKNRRHTEGLGIACRMRIDIGNTVFGTGGGLDKLVKLVNGQIEEVVYISRDGQNMEDGDSKIDGQQASPENARSYLNQIYASAGKEDYFNYDSSVSIYDINGKPLKDESIYRYLYQLNENAGSDLEKNQEAANNYTDANLSGEYIFPDSSNRLLTVQELSGMSDYELQLARNEIFARHGYIFSTPEMATYFESKSWYHGSVSPNNFNIDRDLSQVERDNINLIKSIES